MKMKMKIKRYAAPRMSTPRIALAKKNQKNRKLPRTVR